MQIVVNCNEAGAAKSQRIYVYTVTDSYFSISFFFYFPVNYKIS